MFSTFNEVEFDFDRLILVLVMKFDRSVMDFIDHNQ